MMNLVENKIQESFDDGSILIDTEGSRVGVVNGLAVYSNGEYSFGRPTRITVNTSLGKAGVINIEREADLSGPIHNKGVGVISGFLRQNFNLPKSASCPKKYELEILERQNVETGMIDYVTIPSGLIARNNGNVYICFTTSCDEIEIILVIIKHLSYDIISTIFYFLFDVTNV